MKKEKSLNFLNSKWLIVPLFALGILLFGNVDANAQNSPFANRIVGMEELRDSFAPSSAKYDIVQDAIDYLEILDQQYSSNPNLLNDLLDTTGEDPLKADKLRKTHPTILANYTSAQLAEMQVQLSEYAAGSNLSTPAALKTQWVLDANAY